MEEKWAIFHHQNNIIFVRSWTREVIAVAETEISGDHLNITSIDGMLTSSQEQPDYTVKAIDFLIRSHAMNLVYPAPVPSDLDMSPQDMATFCFSIFGNRALFATPHTLDNNIPQEHLRCISLLHVAVAKNAPDGVRNQITNGIPIDLFGNDGMTPLHWSVLTDDLQMPELLLELGAQIDIRSSDGATPMRLAAQEGKVGQVIFLLENGADPDARDDKGFTAMHTAADRGKYDIVQTLLERGASPDLDANGYTPLSLAEGRGEKALVDLLRQAIDSTS